METLVKQERQKYMLALYSYCKDKGQSQLLDKVMIMSLNQGTLGETITNLVILSHIINRAKFLPQNLFMWSLLQFK